MFSHQNNASGLFATFLHHVQQSPDKKAVIYGDISVTYDEFAKRVDQLARSLKSRYGAIFTATHKPIFIGVNCHSKLEALYAEFAVLALGAAFVPFSVDD